MKPYPSLACAYCLEEAGGRQRAHGIPWMKDTCEVCGEDTIVTRPDDFGRPDIDGFQSPRLEACA